MQYRLLGKTKLNVSTIGLGGNLFGYSCDQVKTDAVIRCAEESGVNLIDTADVYTEGKSEEFIGKATQGRRDKWILASKVGLKKNTSPHGLGKKENIIKRLNQSLKRLGTDYLDLYQIHHFDNSTALEETLEAFNELIQSGKIRYAGCSNFNGNQLELAENCSSKLDGIRFESTQAYYNLLKRDLELSVLPHCKKNKIGVLVYGALGRGVLIGSYIKGKNEDKNSRVNKNPKVKQDFILPILYLLKKLSKFTNEQGLADVSQLVIAWILSQEGVTSAILGCRTVEQLKSNVRATEIKINGNDLFEIDRLIGDFSQYNSASLGHPGEKFLR
jgi:aryl-alcohol dehydrogenase-like predicted oxidoreductase